MTVVDRGQGIPVALVPGIQGRWEYMRPTVEALSRHHRTIVYSLIGEPGTDPPSGEPTIDILAAQLKRVLDSQGVERAVICGVSFGGVVAVRFAAEYPERTAALVLASVPGPGWHLRESHRAYARFPLLSAPLFFAGAPGRLRRELVSALPDAATRHAFVRQTLTMLMRTPVSPSRMAARARLIDGVDNLHDCQRVTAPTLIVTGEPELDFVVSVDGSSLYSTLIAGSRWVTLKGTGHLGSVTRPDEFAATVIAFLDEAGIRAPGEHAA